MHLAHPVETVSAGTVVGKWFPFGVGIDCHKAMVWVCILRPDYKENTQHREITKFETTPDALARMKEWLDSRVPPEHRRFLIESTSTYHFPVLHALPGWIPTVINPKLVGSSKRKTDRWDAQVLAHHCMAGTFPAYVLPTMEEYGWRALYRRVLKLEGTIQRNKKAMATRMCLFGVNYAQSTSSQRGWSIFRSLLLGAHPELGGLPAGHVEELLGLVGQLHRIPRCVLAANRCQIAEVEACQKQREELWSLLVEAVDPRVLRLLESVPHVGQRTAICFACEVGRDPRRRFPRLGQLVAYAGFDPSKRVSADKVTSFIATAGNKFLRRAFVQAASGGMLARTGLGDYGRHIAARIGKRGWFAGVNSIGRRMVKYCYSVLCSGVPFEEGMFHGKEAVWKE